MCHCGGVFHLTTGSRRKRLSYLGKRAIRELSVGLNHDPRYWLYPNISLTAVTKDGQTVQQQNNWHHWCAPVLYWSFFISKYVFFFCSLGQKEREGKEVREKESRYQRTATTESREKKGRLCRQWLIKKAAYGRTTLMCGLHCRSHRTAPGFVPWSSSSYFSATPRQATESR